MTESEFDERPELVRQRARVILLQRMVITVIGLFMVGSMALLTYNAIQSIATRNQLLDCTTPDGDCYKDGQKRTGIIIDALYRQGLDREEITRQIIVIASACADESESQTVIEIQACVDARLKLEGR